MKKIIFNFKRLSNPRIKRRLKIALSIWFGAIMLAVSYKVVYDVGYFDAKSLEDSKNTEIPFIRRKLTLESAQRIVTGALKEDLNNPKTVVIKVVDDNHKLSTIVIENNQERKIAWIIDMRLYFIADVLNGEGVNLTKGFEQHYLLNDGKF